MGNTQIKSFLSKQNILLCAGIILAFATYLIIIIPGLNNAVESHTTENSLFFNIGMWKQSMTGFLDNGTNSLSAIGIIGIIGTALALICFAVGVFFTWKANMLSLLKNKLLLTSAVSAFIVILIFILFISAVPYTTGDGNKVSWMWNDVGFGIGSTSITEYFAFTAGGWVILVISILSGVGFGAAIALNFIPHKASK